MKIKKKKKTINQGLAGNVKENFRKKIGNVTKNNDCRDTTTAYRYETTN